MTNSKKVYVKAYTRLNLGDDLFIHILCHRYQNTTFYIKESSHYTDAFNSISNLIILKDINTISYDAIVYIGGSIFIESSPLSILRLHELKNEIIKENIPTYIIGANFGPYTSQEYLSVVKNELFPYITSITFRDKYSYDLFSNMNNVNYAPDVVFSLNTENIEKKECKEIGISLIYHLEREDLKINYNNYINKLTELSKHYISLGYNIRFFSFCEYEKDMIAINDVLNLMNVKEKQHVNITSYTGNIQNILNEIASLKLFITSRFHAMILGLKLNIPIIPICYSPKCLNVLYDMNYPLSKIYTFNDIENLDYFSIPEIFTSDLFTKGYLQFKYLDQFLKNK